jgi:hypothetical protein
MNTGVLGVYDHGAISVDDLLEQGHVQKDLDEKDVQHRHPSQSHVVVQCVLVVVSVLPNHGPRHEVCHSRLDDLANDVRS